jgi:hypothetical protein
MNYGAERDSRNILELFGIGLTSINIIAVLVKWIISMELRPGVSFRGDIRASRHRRAMPVSAFVGAIATVATASRPC